jgi:hypothetical protein
MKKKRKHPLIKGLVYAIFHQRRLERRVMMIMGQYVTDISYIYVVLMRKQYTIQFNDYILDCLVLAFTSIGCLLYMVRNETYHPAKPRERGAH